MTDAADTAITVATWLLRLLLVVASLGAVVACLRLVLP